MRGGGTGDGGPGLVLQVWWRSRQGGIAGSLWRAGRRAARASTARTCTVGQCERCGGLACGAHPRLGAGELQHAGICCGRRRPGCPLSDRTCLLSARPCTSGRRSWSMTGCGSGEYVRLMEKYPLVTGGCALRCPRFLCCGPAPSGRLRRLDAVCGRRSVSSLHLPVEGSRSAPPPPCLLVQALCPPPRPPHPPTHAPLTSPLRLHCMQQTCTSHVAALPSLPYPYPLPSHLPARRPLFLRLAFAPAVSQPRCTFRIHACMHALARPPTHLRRIPAPGLPVPASDCRHLPPHGRGHGQVCGEG